MASKCSKDECIQENVSSYEEYCSVSGLFFLLLQYVILKKLPVFPVILISSLVILIMQG